MSNNWSLNYVYKSIKFRENINRNTAYLRKKKSCFYYISSLFSLSLFYPFLSPSISPSFSPLFSRSIYPSLFCYLSLSLSPLPLSLYIFFSLSLILPLSFSLSPLSITLYIYLSISLPLISLSLSFLFRYFTWCAVISYSMIGYCISGSNNPATTSSLPWKIKHCHNSTSKKVNKIKAFMVRVQFQWLFRIGKMKVWYLNLIAIGAWRSRALRWF